MFLIISFFLSWVSVLFICIYLWLFLHLSICLSIYLSTYLSLTICIYPSSVPVFLFSSIIFFPFASFSIHHLFICLFIYSFIYLLSHLFLLAFDLHAFKNKWIFSMEAYSVGGKLRQKHRDEALLLCWLSVVFTDFLCCVAEEVSFKLCWGYSLPPTRMCGREFRRKHAGVL